MQLSAFAENTIDCASTILLYQLYKFDFKNYDRERSKKKNPISSKISFNFYRAQYFN